MVKVIIIIIYSRQVYDIKEAVPSGYAQIHFLWHMHIQRQRVQISCHGPLLNGPAASAAEAGRQTPDISSGRVVSHAPDHVVPGVYPFARLRPRRYQRRQSHAQK